MLTAFIPPRALVGHDTLRLQTPQYVCTLRSLPTGSVQQSRRKGEYSKATMSHHRGIHAYRRAFSCDLIRIPFGSHWALIRIFSDLIRILFGSYSVSLDSHLISFDLVRSQKGVLDLIANVPPIFLSGHCSDKCEYINVADSAIQIALRALSAEIPLQHTGDHA